MNQSIKLGNFVPWHSVGTGSHISEISFYIKIAEDDKNRNDAARPGTILSWRANYVQTIDMMAPLDDTCNYAHEPEMKNIVIDLSLDSCGHPILSYDGIAYYKSADDFANLPQFKDKYAYFVLRIEQSPEVELMTMSMRSGNDWSTSSWIPTENKLWGTWQNKPDQDSEFYIGSYLGASNFFRGFLGEFKFGDGTAISDTNPLADSDWS
jgi:hypothetical protein